MIISELLRRIGRGTGIAGGIVAIVLWGRFVGNVLSNPEGGGSPTVAGVMALLAVLAIAAAWFDRPAALMVAFAMSFVPVGLYLLGTPSIYAGIGIANLLYLVAAVLLWGSRLAARRASPLP